MDYLGDKRNIVEMAKEICIENNFLFKSYSNGWFLKISNSSLNRYVTGYRFDLNTSAVDRICSDKAATSLLLDEFNIKNVLHVFIRRKKGVVFTRESCDYKGLVKMLLKHKKLVVKPNNGTCGSNVFLVNKEKDLIKVINSIFIEDDVAVSPYFSIDIEYRVIALDGKVELVYYKERPFIIGDGAKVFSELIDIKYPDYKENDDYYSGYENTDVVEEGVIVYLNWKHNLGLGASPVIVSDELIVSKLNLIVAQVVKCLNLRFGSIDIIKVGDDYFVLEINSGIMMEFFSRCSKDNYEIAKNIYRRAILTMFN